MREIELFYQRIRIVCGSNYNLNTFPTKGGQSAGRKKFAKFELLKKLQCGSDLFRMKASS